MASFLNPIAARNPLTPIWYGPVLPRSVQYGPLLALGNPNAAPTIQVSGPVFPAPSTNREAITSALRMLLGTRLGERIFQPEYGLNMDALVFEVLDAQTTQSAEALIRSTITKFIFGVQVVSVQITSEPNNNAVTFSITIQILGGTPDDLFTYTTSSLSSA